MFTDETSTGPLFSIISIAIASTGLSLLEASTPIITSEIEHPLHPKVFTAAQSEQLPSGPMSSLLKIILLPKPSKSRYLLTSEIFDSFRFLTRYKRDSYKTEVLDCINEIYRFLKPMEEEIDALIKFKKSA